MCTHCFFFFFITLLYGTDWRFCRELDRATNRSQSLCFGEMGVMGRTPGVRADEEKGYNSTSPLPATFPKDGSKPTVSSHHPTLPDLPPEPCIHPIH